MNQKWIWFHLQHILFRSFRAQKPFTLLALGIAQCYDVTALQAEEGSIVDRQSSMKESILSASGLQANELESLFEKFSV